MTKIVLKVIVAILIFLSGLIAIVAMHYLDFDTMYTVLCIVVGLLVGDLLVRVSAI